MNIWDDIALAKAIIDSMPPFLTEIWIVESPHLVGRIREMVADNEIGASPVGYMASSGVQVVEWERDRVELRWTETPPFDPPDCDPMVIKSLQYLRHLDAEQKRRGNLLWPWIVAFPGIWGKMSDGSWARVEGK